MKSNLFIDGHVISEASDYLVIAEIGHNHQGDLENCIMLFDAAKSAGATAVKLQKRDNKALFTKEFYNQPYNSPNAYGSTYGIHREKLEFGREQYNVLIEHAKKIGITFFSTPFDISSANFLADLGMPAFKIASADIRNIPLLRHVAQFEKPMIISTGGASLSDVERAVEEIAKYNLQLAIMQCSAVYPPKDQELNLRVIETYKKHFSDFVIGYSGHDVGINMTLIAAALGARIIEKHFTLDHTLKGTDHALSLEPQEMALLVKKLKRIKHGMGNGVKEVQDVEKQAIIKMGKKIVAAHDLVANHLLSLEDIAIKSPGDGLSPDHLPNILNKRLIKALKADENITYECLQLGVVS